MRNGLPRGNTCTATPILMRLVRAVIAAAMPHRGEDKNGTRRVEMQLREPHDVEPPAFRAIDDIEGFLETPLGLGARPMREIHEKRRIPWTEPFMTTPAISTPAARCVT